MDNSSRALLVIDIQNDYFPGGSMPLWRADETLARIVRAVKRARELGMPVVLVQHVEPPSEPEGFFTKGSKGVEIHPAILAAAPAAPVVIKHNTDAFRETNLNEVLDGLGVKELLVCGMQTQNCVGLATISKSAAKYKVSMLGDCCTAPIEAVHEFALAGFGEIIPVVNSDEVLG